MPHYHRYYSLGPYSNSVCVIFEYLGPYTVTLHFQETDDVSSGTLNSDDNAIFKIPKGYECTIEVCEVAIGPGTTNGGRYTFSAQLHPAPTEAVINALKAPGSEEDLKVILPVGECTGSGECSESGSVLCPVGKVPNCNNGVLECIDDQRGGGS